MAEFVLSFVFLLIIVAAMAVGVMRGKAPISGSCGGLNRVGLGGPCDICGGDTSKCEEEGPSIESESKSKFYNAS